MVPQFVILPIDITCTALNDQIGLSKLNSTKFALILCAIILTLQFYIWIHMVAHKISHNHNIQSFLLSVTLASSSS